jgi:hypothetical protein
VRKHTDPGLAPPAPGSVAPLTLDTDDWQDEVPTKPDNALQPELLELVRLIDSMPIVERRRFLAMARNYGRAGLGRRVLLEEIAREFAHERKT